MSVKNPLISELKGLTSELLKIGGDIEDKDVAVSEACQCLERILLFGIRQTAGGLPYQSLITLIAGNIPESGTTGHIALWNWLKHVASQKLGASYSYICAVDNAKKSTKVRTTRGRTRLMIRTSLVKRCIHVPIQLIINENLRSVYYKNDSILGDEVLCEVLLSVLMLWSTRIYFKLDLNNARFLDDTWTIPHSRAYLTPPTAHLGVSVTFISGMAVVVQVMDFSVAAENADIHVGDILDELNGYCITENFQGTLGNVMRKSAGQPVSLSIIKAGWNGGIFPALVPILREARVDVNNIIKKQLKIATVENNADNTDVADDDIEVDVKYVGSIAVPEGSLGRRGSHMKQIEMAIQHFRDNPSMKSSESVTFEFENLGLRVVPRNASSQQPENILLKHFFMEISSCATTSYAPDYFAYIAGKESCSLSDSIKSANMTCHVFQCSDTKEIDSLLRIMGQGFKRTHFTV